jgi:hypothetical protein
MLSQSLAPVTLIKTAAGADRAVDAHLTVQYGYGICHGQCGATGQETKLYTSFPTRSVSYRPGRDNLVIPIIPNDSKNPRNNRVVRKVRKTRVLTASFGKTRDLACTILHMMRATNRNSQNSHEHKNWSS